MFSHENKKGGIMEMILRGVYQITCECDEKEKRIYIGSSKNIEKRWKDHRKDLRRGKHRNIKFQQCWDKHGEKSFKFEILMLCVEDQLLFWEQDFLDRYCNTFVDGKRQCKNESLNMNQYAHKYPSKEGENHPMFGKYHDDETRKKMSDSHKDENHYLFGKHHSEETKRKLSKANKGKKHTEVTRQKMSDMRKEKCCGERNGMYGKKHTEETKKKMRETKRESNERRRLEKLESLSSKKDGEKL